MLNEVSNSNSNKNNSVQNAGTLPKMRTVKEAADEIRKLDPNTAVTQYHIRQLAMQGILPRVQAGKKLLINLDEVLEYLKNPTAPKFTERRTQAQAAQTTTSNGIRKIK